MANTHLQTAHDFGVQKALEKAGYASVDDVTKEAQALGLVPSQKQAAASSLDELFKTLK